MLRSVRKAVLPAAGLGTRFLPATKAQPKEMLPVVDKPIIQYSVEEAAASGIDNIIIVTGRGKSSIEDHFDVSFELESILESQGKTEPLSIVRNISGMVNFAYVRQNGPRGLGHAVLRARELVGDEPFAVALADDLIDARIPCLKQMLDVYNCFGAPVLAVMEVPSGEISSYGAIAIDREEQNSEGRKVYRISNLVEKPKPSDAPSNFAIIGRYILTPDVFDCIEATEPDARGEVQLTDALKRLLGKRPIYACPFEGTRYDAGDKLGFLKATVELALRRKDDLAVRFREYLSGSPELKKLLESASEASAGKR